jgi:diacylglycerol kinase (ATP)
MKNASRVGPACPTAMRACVIFNPTAKGDKARHFRRHLDTLGSAWSLKPTTAAGMARTLAAQAVNEGSECIVAAGGDGTVNEVLNGIGDAPDGFARVRLAVLPLGTVNVFARELRLPIHLERAWGVIERGRETAVDLPSIEFMREGQLTRRYFAQLAGAGLDARAVELVSWRLKKKAGVLAYVHAGLAALREVQPRMTVTGGGRTESGELVLIGNGRLYGGPFPLFDQADLRDGLLDVRVFPRANWRTALAIGWGILTSRLARAGGSENFRTEALTLTASSRVPLELDGEAVGELPATVRIQRQTLRVIVP